MRTRLRQLRRLRTPRVKQYARSIPSLTPLHRNLVSVNIATHCSSGYKYMPWYKLSMAVLFFYLAITLCVLFYRPDFVNVSGIVFSN